MGLMDAPQFDVEVGWFFFIISIFFGQMNVIILLLIGVVLK